MNDVFGLPERVAIHYGEDDIRRCLPGEIEKGRSYFLRGAVRRLRVEDDGQRLAAEVEGTAARPYRVDIQIAKGKRVTIVGRCSCPVAWNCKHCAAVLLQALDAQPERHPPRAADALAGPLADWLAQLPRDGAGTGGEEMLVYRLDHAKREQEGFLLEARVVRRLKSGRYGAGRQCSLAQLEGNAARYVGEEDRVIGRLIRDSHWIATSRLPNEPAALNLLMERLVATGRLYWRDLGTPPLALGPIRRGAFRWRLRDDGSQTVEPYPPDNSAEVLRAAAPWYVNPQANLAGPLDFGLPAAVVRAFLAAPPVMPEQAAPLAAALARDFPGLALPRPRTDLVEETVRDPPIPVLRLVNRKRDWGYYYRPNTADETVDLALLGFDYGGTILDPDEGSRELRRVEQGRVIVRRRQLRAERAAAKRLARYGLGDAPDYRSNKDEELLTAYAFEGGATAWAAFLFEAVPELERDDWRIETEDGFRPRVVDGGGEWNAAFSEKGDWWFSLDLGIEFAGDRVPLLPVLTSLLRSLGRAGMPDSIDDLARNGTVFAALPDGRLLALPLDRTKAILSTLVELYNPENLRSDGSLDISLGEASALAQLEAATRLRWLGGERLRDLAARLSDFAGIAPVAPPEGLRAELRPYQQSGLDWLQFLREYDLGGILADDMGLGKTVQTLAHILVEKRAGRLDRQCLVVCPTSVVPNWIAEAARFAPELRVLSLHGPDRAARFPAIPDSDVVLTTYALLPRDAERLLAVKWHLAALDEAQAIKNAASKATQIVCRIEARHRLCLTGTPVENHLGELWSQFAFLMPGLLGDGKRFTRVFRTPIEKRRDLARQAVLSARLKPFLLRRTKALVAPELPQKTEIVSRLELSGPQRDLYETVRLAMHAKVQQEIAAKGFARSHIVILDALLKLRQVCCDPRLVKLAAARGIAASAKLARLMEMLPAMVEEGRRILLFSQFTSMLDLIKPELARSGIEFAELRGDTADRAAPVRRFQDGAVPLFLVSLRAGGTGLNLTAADTVVHYDPWWNPAVEDQATDRAHRIGQEKPVFVYKLVAEGTVEERMLELQERKRAIAAGIYGDRQSDGPLLNAADIERLFEPLG